MPSKLKNGVSGAMGGARKGAGRKPNEFKTWIRDLAHNPKSRLRLKKILQDEQDAEADFEDGKTRRHAAKADTYLRALELAWNYAEGKPASRLELAAGNSGRMVFIFPDGPESK